MVKFDSFDSKQEHKQMTNKDSLLFQLDIDLILSDEEMAQKVREVHE